MLKASQIYLFKKGGGGGILRSSFWLWIQWCYMKTRIHLDVLYIQVVVYSIYINLFSLHAGDCMKTNSNLIASFRLFIEDRSYIVRIIFLNELFAKLKIGESLVLLSWNQIAFYLRYFSVLVYIMRDILVTCSPLPKGRCMNKIASSP